CLEVKGGDVARKEGVWRFTDRYGQTNTKKEGPFEQVGKASSALHRFLKERCSGFSAVVGYGVVMPDVVFKDEGPDIELSVLYDRRDNDQPFRNYMARLAGYWRERVHVRGEQLSLQGSKTIV